jgi:hypothetical protein
MDLLYVVLRYCFENIVPGKLFFFFKIWRSIEEQVRSVETAEMRFLIAVAGFRMTYHKRSEDIGKEPRITGANRARKHYEVK